MYLILPTKYGSANELRFKLFLKTIKTALNHNEIKRIIVVDSSSDKVFEQLKIILNNERIDLLDQKDKRELKGGSIREGIEHILKIDDNRSIIAFQEPEKDNMIFHYASILEMNKELNSYICIPRRTRSSFDSYPKEQYFSETFMNMYLTKLTNLDIDWSFGPVVFTSDMGKYWMGQDGKLWDGQIIPIYRAMLEGNKISEYRAPFWYPSEQKEMEEDNLEFIEKRRYQLNYMVEKMMKERNQKKGDKNKV
jgi:hypothetical protein